MDELARPNIGAGQCGYNARWYGYFMTLTQKHRAALHGPSVSRLACDAGGSCPHAPKKLDVEAESTVCKRFLFLTDNARL